jgi:hypothetical protein
MSAENQLLDEDKIFWLKSCLTVRGYSTDDDHWGMQALRDNFPAGVPWSLALEILREVNLQEPYLEAGALFTLAMVPVPEAEEEVLKRLGALKLEKSWDRETGHLCYRLSKSLYYLHSPRAESEMRETLERNKARGLYPDSFDCSWLREHFEELEQWEQDLRNGKRWEPED